MQLSNFDPLIQQWFSECFQNATEPQLLGWAEISKGRDTLISAPTGSGKTLAAFLICLDGLVRKARTNSLPDETQVVYVSPLKALSNDIQKNLDLPLQQIRAIAEREGITLAPIRTAVRTGDTPMSQRQSMTRKPPHILVTTPESLYILVTAESSRKMLRKSHTIIVDEIHAVAGDKRGAHLALTLSRLEALCENRPQRIGLSATVKPIEDVAQFLAPHVSIVNTGHRRQMELKIEIPLDELGPIASNEMWGEIYDRISQLILAHRTTLVFVNTRRLSERVAHALAERLGEDQVLAHHGSLSRPMRLRAETRLKNNDVRAVVATASLELGIDVGSIELVVQIGSPRNIAVALQRVGRSGHWVGAMPKGHLFVTTRDDLIECAAVVRSIRAGELENISIPQNSLDIAAQQIVAACACEPWKEEDLYKMVRSAYPYRDFPREDFEALLVMLSEGIATSRGRNGALLHRDQINGMVRGRRGARLIAITCGGAIPDNANYNVVAEPDGRTVGTLDEDFAIESLAGDIFLLGTQSWRIKRVESGRIRVEDAKGAPPTVPFWNGEAPGRSAELSTSVAKLREDILNSTDIAALAAQCGLDDAGMRQAEAYVQAGTAALGALPTQDTVIAERFFDEAGGMQLVIHSPFGSRVNRAWGLALRKKFCRTFNFELQAAATDNGIVISLSEQHAFPLELVFEFLKAATVKDVLSQALLPAPMFGTRWRWNATRSLALLRFAGGRRVPPPILRMRSDDLLAAVFPDQVACAENLTGPPRIPDHPLVRETMDNCLHGAMDVDGLRRIVERIGNRTLKTVAVETTSASPFSHEILSANPYAFLDDAPLEERRTRAVQLRSTLGQDFADGVGMLDPQAIEEVSAESWPLIRDADELHDALLTMITVPAIEDVKPWFDVLQNTGRASTIERQGRTFWVATEKKHLIDDVTAILRGWMESIGPTTAAALSERLGLPVEAVQQSLLQLESEGQVFQGHFAQQKGEKEWCNRRILARIHRLTLGRLRKEIEPVTTTQFHRFLSSWQHEHPGSQLVGVEGTLQIIKQLQGYEIPASAWEPEIFQKRINGYEPEFLDDLCLSGEVMWGRLSPHPAMESAESRQVRPTRIAPISFFLREDAGWLMQQSQPNMDALSHAAREVHAALEQYGASFFADLVRATHRLPSEVEDALWQLVAAGLVTADGFENLRSLIDPKRRRGEGRARNSRPRHAAGRWALLRRLPSDITEQQRLEKIAQQLLLRWGVVLRDMMTKDSMAPPWRDLLPVLRKMEAQGIIRGGRFADAFIGEQYARPEALELLRKIRREHNTADSQLAVSSASPLATASAGQFATLNAAQLMTPSVAQLTSSNASQLAAPSTSKLASTNAAQLLTSNPAQLVSDVVQVSNPVSNLVSNVRADFQSAPPRSKNQASKKPV